MSKKSVMKGSVNLDKEVTKAPIWRIYYHNRSTFDSTMGLPADAPSTGVVCIVQNHTSQQEGGYIVTAFKDFYWRENNEWWGSDEVGFWQYMFEPGAKVVKFGISIPTVEFNEIMKKASEDVDFGIRNKTLLDFDNLSEWSSET
jgi:hypothetical protein